MYLHTLNLLEQETGTTGVLTPCCPFDDNDDNDDDNDDDVGESRKKTLAIQKPIGSFSLTTVNTCIYQTFKPTENLFYLYMQNYY